ncbi:MAG TPA: circularly permuted type 2 ATP-grasp protein [Ferruginibacter sp.]|nr:circularly permuted type 2 ATP-grasp protein [Ferruginibacter sp.]HMP20233.1 circularly permuted type 2 ATP-grasp protein [Ferruginibacter sp.]
MPEQTDVFNFLSQYYPSPGSYNEIAPGSTGRLTPEWKAFFSAIQDLGLHEIQNRSSDILRLLKENGVTYNIYNDPSGDNRPWELDPIPQIINTSEWDNISKGLAQRAILLDLILKDIYGPQMLIKEGLLPQEIVYMHPGFLRPCANIQLPASQHLVVYAADLGRGDDGKQWVISDRTQAPSGYGYALENRVAMSGVFPELFSSLEVNRLASYFNTMQQALNKIAPYTGKSPRVIILTPGPENETYFEHAYLSAYMGLTLVQGSDLMVKDNFLWLKTIEGLEKVDVVLRRMDDVYCDPLELKSDSLLGIPGLLQVVRKGNVAIANPLGSSVVENAGMMPFFDAAARKLLGEDLLIPSIATWWCGQPKEMQYVINNLQHLVIRKIFRNRAGTRSAIDGASLSAAETENLVREIKANPSLFAGQEKINFSSTPCWVNGRVQPGHSLIRSFLVRKDESYFVMPGGLTRTSNRKNSFVISNQTGDFSKDTWVIASGQDIVRPVRYKLRTGELPSAFPRGSLPSHTAENLFWAGRYTNRIINNARLLRTVMQYMMQNVGAPIIPGSTTETLLTATTLCTYTFPGFFPDIDNPDKPSALEDPWTELAAILYQQGRDGSIEQNLGMFKRAVHSVRNFWSIDNWRVIRQTEDNWAIAKNSGQHDPHSMINHIDTLNTSMFAFLGMIRESARREQEWMLMDLGRKFEQVLFFTRLLQNILYKKTDEQGEYELLETILIATQSMTTYRYTYRDHLQLPHVLQLLLLDMSYPKSLAYLTEKIKNYIVVMPRTNNTGHQPEQERLITEAYQLLRHIDLNALVQYEGEDNEYINLYNTLDKLHRLVSGSCEMISKTYFRHTPLQKQLFVAEVA